MNVEERVKKLEIQLTRLMRRSRKVSTIYTPPIPISFVAEINGLEGKVTDFFFPMAGKIGKIVVESPTRPKKVIRLNLSLSYKGGGESKIFDIESKVFSTLLNTNHVENTNIIIKVKSEEEISKISVGLIWYPDLKEHEAKNFLINELEKEVM